MIDVLPDRKKLCCLVAAHPEIVLVSRDRGGDYASAAANIASQAIQCANRFHVLKNLIEALKRLLVRYLAAHRTRQTEESRATPLETIHDIQPPKLSPKEAQQSQAKREGAPCSIPAHRNLTEARLLADDHCWPGRDKPYHGLALVGAWHIS